MMVKWYLKKIQKGGFSEKNINYKEKYMKYKKNILLCVNIKIYEINIFFV